MTCKDCFHYEVCCDEYELEHAEYCNNFKDKSKVIELPCKVGDTVYDLIDCISSTNQKKYRIRQSTVQSIYYNQCKNGESIVLIYVSVNGRLAVLNKKAFGFTAFLTKEEAEQKLKEAE